MIIAFECPTLTLDLHNYYLLLATYVANNTNATAFHTFSPLLTT